MFQFNSNKLIKLCRKLIGMIDDNQIAEELTDKIVGIETKYQSKFEAQNKYKIIVEGLVLDYNKTISPNDNITIIEQLNNNWNIIQIYVTNRHNFILSPSDPTMKNKDLSYKWVLNKIMTLGIDYYFSSERKWLYSGLPTKKYHGEESFNVTHS